MVETELKFTKTHEWIEAQGARRKVGISNFAQEQLGDIVFVEFPEDEKHVKTGDEVCIVESCKATASIYAPVAGRVVATNTALADAPEKINDSPYEEGWLFEIEVDDGADESALLDQADYLKLCEEEH